MKLKITTLALAALMFPFKNHAWGASAFSETVHETPIKKIARINLLEKNCVLEHIEKKQLCLQTTCLDPKKNSTGQSSCLKKVCKHIRKTKDITCLKWKKPQVKNPGTKK